MRIDKRSPVGITPDRSRPLLEVENLRVTFGGSSIGTRRTRVLAVDGVSLSLDSGETLGLAGESGSGKSTLGYAILGHYPCETGSVAFDGEDITHAGTCK